MDYNITLFFVSRTWDWPQEVGSAQAHSRTDIKIECDVGYKTQSSLVRNSKCVFLYFPGSRSKKSVVVFLSHRGQNTSLRRYKCYVLLIELKNS